MDCPECGEGGRGMAHVQIDPNDLDELTKAVAPLNLDAASIVAAALLLVAGFVLAAFARRAIRKFGAQFEFVSPVVTSAVARLTGYLIIALGLFSALRVLGIDLVPLLGGLGLIAIVVAFALRPFLENFASGMVIQAEHPIELGDYVIIDGYQGTVTELKARTLQITTIDGEVVYIPNNTVLNSSLTNLSAGGKRRTTLDVGLAYETDLATAAHLITETVTATADVLVDPAPEVFIHEFGDSTINAAVRFWHGPSFRTGWEARHAVAVEIKKALDANDVEIAFPQRVLWSGDGRAPGAA